MNFHGCVTVGVAECMYTVSADYRRSCTDLSLYSIEESVDLIDQATDKVKKLDPTIDLANQSMQKIQAPLDTAVKLSGTVDEIHDKAVDSAGKLSAAVTEGMDSLNEFVNDKFKKKDDVPFNPVETPVKPAEPEHKESQEEEAHE